MYIDVYLYGLYSFFFEGKGDWSLAKNYLANIFGVMLDGKSLSVNKKIEKDSVKLSINVYQFEALFLVFEL